MAAGDLYQDPQATTQRRKPMPAELAGGAAMTNGDLAGAPEVQAAPSHDARPAPAAAPAPAQTVAPPPAPAAPTPGVRVGANDWVGLGITPAQATPGMAIPGQPGKVLDHQNGGWVIKDAAAAAPPPPAAPAAPAAPPPPATPAPAPPITTIDQATATTTNAGQQTPQGQPTSIAQSFQQALVNKLNPAAVTADNPAIAPAIQANRLAEQRGLEMQKNALAEKAARSGTSMSGGNDALERGLIADSAMRQGQYSGDLVQHLQDQQNADLMAAIGLGNSTLQTNAGRAQQESQFGRTLDEQRRQADIDAELRRLGITTGASTAASDIALRGRLGDQANNLSLLSLLMNNDQFGRQLNQQGNQFGASLDQSGILGLLGLL